MGVYVLAPTAVSSQGLGAPNIAGRNDLETEIWRAWPEVRHYIRLRAFCDSKFVYRACDAASFDQSCNLFRPGGRRPSGWPPETSTLWLLARVAYQRSRSGLMVLSLCGYQHPAWFASPTQPW